MIKHNGIILIIFTLLSLLLSTSCSVSPVEIKDVESVKIVSFKNDTIIFEALFPVNNPNNYRFKITDIDLDVLLDGDAVGRIQKIKDLKIPPNRESLQRIRFNMVIPDRITGGLYLLKMITNQALNIEIKGHIIGKALCIKKKVDVNEQITLHPFRKK